MEDILYYLNLLGIHVPVDNNSPMIVQFALILLLFGSISYLCIINISIYLIVLYVCENKKVLEFVSKKAYRLKIFNYYKFTSKFFLVVEFLFLFVNLGLINYFCFRIMYIFANS